VRAYKLIFYSHFFLFVELGMKEEGEEEERSRI
jgi:hypothetical protein